MKTDISYFDDIRPYNADELPQAINDLLNDINFHPILKKILPHLTIEDLRNILKQCPDSLAIQKTIFHPLLIKLANDYTAGVSFDANSITDKTQNRVFISNHRDIVIDPAFLCKLMIENNFQTTVEIAIGDNLLIYPWIKTLVRINKSFIVQRSISLKQLLNSSKHMSEYIHFAIQEKKENIWIAQREGRAKDSDDRTDTAILKMLTMGGDGTIVDKIKKLNLTPLTISYEYDPCDYLKAKEFQQKRDNPNFKKTPADDLQNMQIGIFGFKGRVHFETATPLNTFVEEHKELAKIDFFDALAKHIDQEIFQHYRLYPGNYIAFDLLHQKNLLTTFYTAEEKEVFITYLKDRLALIDLPNKDESFLWEKLLTMYANPAKNKLSLLQTK